MGEDGGTAWGGREIVGLGLGSGIIDWDKVAKATSEVFYLTLGWVHKSVVLVSIALAEEFHMSTEYL